MAMVLMNTRVLVRAMGKYRDAAKALREWAEIAAAANWSTLNDVRRIFPSADGVSVKVKGVGVVVATVFNIKGNRYRLITVIDYSGATVTLTEFLTHGQYSKDEWKGRL